ncbi:MAG: hypothetical protein LBQ59_03615 [Candidatus Peribacteria bacterium]|nr:hypothetical protein [Candidatus Peribacteria bacterium]
MSIFDARFDTFQIAFSLNNSFSLFTATIQALSYHLYSSLLSHSTKELIELFFQLYANIQHIGRKVRK